jgi:F1F0 ATPase subunit 2
LLVGLEMDEQHMSPPPFSDLRDCTALIGFGAYLGGGMLLGLLYFYALWWNVRQIARRSSATLAISLAIGRFLLLGGLLFLASLEGAMPLLLVALGILAARAMVMRQFLRVAP